MLSSLLSWILVPCNINFKTRDTGSKALPMTKQSDSVYCQSIISAQLLHVHSYYESYQPLDCHRSSFPEQMSTNNFERAEGEKFSDNDNGHKCLQRRRHEEYLLNLVLNQKHGNFIDGFSKANYLKKTLIELKTIKF